jgi:hypothetical protein
MLKPIAAATSAFGKGEQANEVRSAIDSTHRGRWKENFPFMRARRLAMQKWALLR